MTSFVGLPMEVQFAAQWARRSLENGSKLSILVSLKLGSLTTARLLAPKTVAAGSFTPLDNIGRGIQERDVDVIAARVLEEFRVAGVRALVVEDDLARRGDSIPGNDVAYVEDHVVRWVDLADGSDGEARLLRTGASGYPLNAYACWLSPSELALEPGWALGGEELHSIVASTCAVLGSVFDAEAFVALMAPELGARLE